MAGDLTLKVIITASGQQLVETMQAAGKSVESLGERAKASFAGLGRAIDGAARPLQDMGRKLSIGVTAPLTAAFGATAMLVRGFADSADAIAKSARGAGMAASSFQELEFALGQVSNADPGEIARGFEQINTTLGQAIAGDKGAVAKLNSLGFAVEELADTDTEMVFNALLKALDETGSAADAAALASETLGERIGRSLGPQLRGAGDDVAALRQQFVDLGLAIDDESLAQAEKFNDALDTFSREFGGLGREIAAALLPLANDFVPVLRDTLLPSLKSASEGLADAMKAFQELPDPVKKAAAVILAALTVGGPVMLAIGTFIAVVGGIPIAIGAALLAGAALFVTFKDDIGAAVTASVDAVRGLYEGVQEWLGDKLAAVFETVDSVVRSAAAPFQWLQRVVVGNSYVPDMVDAIEGEFGRLGDVMVKPSEAATSAIASAFDQVGRDVAGHIGQMVRQGEITLSNFADFVDNMVQRIIDRTVQMAVVEPLAAALAGGFAGAFAPAAAAAHGLAFAGGEIVQPFAKGGVVSRPTLFPFAKGIGLMGEAGPEAILPLTRLPGGDLGVRADVGRPSQGDVIVNVYDQRTQENDPVEIKDRIDPSGRRVIDVLVRDHVNRAIVQGHADRALGQRFGMRPKAR